MQVTTAELSKITKLSPTTLRERVRKYAMPGADTHRQGYKMLWDLAVVVPWLLNFYKTQNSPAIGSKSLAAERLRLLSEQADREALDNARRRGEVIKYEDAEGCFMAVATLLAGRLDGVAGRLANELVNEPNAAVIRDRIFTEHRAIRESLAVGIQDFVDKYRQEAEQDYPTAS